VSKKIKKVRKLKNLNREKKLIKSIKILKKLTGSIRFRFYKPKTEKTKPNLNRKKLSQTGKKPSQTEKTKPNRFEPVFVLKNQTEPKPVGLKWFRFFLKKISVWLFFFYKIRTEPKIITPNQNGQFVGPVNWRVNRVRIYFWQFILQIN
jgi:hypothetical protein